MKKLRIFLTTFLMIFALAFAGCQGRSSEPTIDNKEVFEEDLQPLEGEELENMENPDISDEEMFALEEEELDKLGEISQEEESDDQGGAIVVKEDGTYTSKDEVATYIYQFKKLPSNYITKSEAQKLGWDSSRGNLDEVAPGKSIGGDVFKNYDKMLPEVEGRTYRECDVDFEGGYRNEKRLVYSNDGLVFYTGDHYKTFSQVY